MSVLAIFVAATASASSHREAPNISRFPTLDSTDFYVFNSYEEGKEEYVTLIANYIPLQDAYGGPNYFAMDPAATYSIHIDNDGDAIEDLTFAFNFTKSLPNNNAGIALNVGPQGNQKSIAVPLINIGGISAGNEQNANFKESYEITLISGDMRTGSQENVANADAGTTKFDKPLDYIGNKTFTDMQGYHAYANTFIHNITIPNCEAMGRVFVGQRKDPFVVNLGETFDLVNYVPVEGDSMPGAEDGAGFPNGITQNSMNDDLIDKNVTSIAIEVPKAVLLERVTAVLAHGPRRVYRKRGF